MKKNNKKGFTLAELLIVVAIIAVLTAIAVPLFVGALGNAEEKVGTANCRAIRGLAIGAILGDSSITVTKDTDYYGYGEVAANGEVSNLQYGDLDKAKAFTGGLKATAADTYAKSGDIEKATETVNTITNGAYIKVGDTYYCIVKIHASDLQSA